MQAFRSRAERLSLEDALERLADDLEMPTAEFVAAPLNAARHNARDLALPVGPPRRINPRRGRHASRDRR